MNEQEIADIHVARVTELRKERDALRVRLAGYQELAEAHRMENEMLRKEKALAFTQGFKRGAEDMRERCAQEAEGHNLVWLAQVLRNVPVVEES